MGIVLGVDGVEAAAKALADGKLVAFPTETVYGLGADAGSAPAVGAIFEAKGRPRGHPLIVHLAHRSELDRFGARVPDGARALAEAFWPGPLTIVVDRTDAVAPETVGGLPSVGLRVPDHPIAAELLRVFGGGVAAPSANRFGSVSPTTAQHVIDDLGPAVDYILDGGPSAVGVESTIVDLTGDRPRLLRPGGISVVELEAVLGVDVLDDRSGPSRAPGMLASHYAPRVTVELVTPETQDRRSEVQQRLAAPGRDTRLGLIAPFEVDHEFSWVLPPDASAYAARLYATLRDADRFDLDRLLIVPPGEGPMLDAVLDRLTKAAAPR